VRNPYGIDLSDGGEENPPRIRKNHWRGALVALEMPLSHRILFGKKRWGLERRCTGGALYGLEPDMLNTSDGGLDISDLVRYVWPRSEYI
jgi:hypothetical protein